MTEQEKNKYRSEVTRYRVELAGKMTGKVLDVGGGIGTYIPYFNSADVTILDPNEEALAYAECSHKVVGDALHMPFEDNEFDSIWACTCCYFFNFEKFLQEVNRVGKNGAKLIVVMANPDTPYDRIKRLFGMRTWSDYANEFDYFRMYKPEELRQYGKVTGEVRFFPAFFDKAIRNKPFFWHVLALEVTIRK